jgi:hypothetical protein
MYSLGFGIYCRFQVQYEHCPEPCTQCPGGFEGVKVVVERGSLNCSSPLRLARQSC